MYIPPFSIIVNLWLQVHVSLSRIGVCDGHARREACAMLREREAPNNDVAEIICMTKELVEIHDLAKLVES
jgi:hypothetical protein